METTFAAAKLLVATALVLASLILPAAALAAPDEGPGAVTIAPDPLEVPLATVGDQGEWLAVDVAYEGEGEAAIDKITLLGEEAGEFTSKGSDCGVLFSGQHCTAWFALKPSSLGEKQATLEVRFQGTRPTETRPVISGAVPPLLSFDPASFDFGAQWVGRGGNHYVELENTGSASVSVESVAVAGPDAGNFWIGANGCLGWPLQPGQSCWLEVNFQPWDVRPYEATLVAQAAGTGFEAALSGAGGTAALAPATNPVDLGSAGAGSRGAVQTIVLTNHGNLPGTFFIAVVAGGDAGSFELISEDCSAAAVEPGASCAVQVRFVPDSPGKKTARLAMFGENDGGTMVLLEGEALLSSVGFVSPSGFDLGSQEAGTRGTARTLWAVNEGSGPVWVDRVALTGRDPDQFVIAGDECTDSMLEPGAGCELRIRFAPDSAGLKQTSLRIFGDFGTFGAELTGTGVDPEPAGAPASPAASAAASTAVPAAKPNRKRFAHNKTIRAPKWHKASRKKRSLSSRR